VRIIIIIIILLLIIEDCPRRVIDYDYKYLTCKQKKLTDSQLSLPHIMGSELKRNNDMKI